MFPRNPLIEKELAEERQREILEDVEAEELAEGDIPADAYPSEDFKPLTNSKHDLVPTPKHNRHIHGDEGVGGE